MGSRRRWLAALLLVGAISGTLADCASECPGAACGTTDGVRTCTYSYSSTVGQWLAPHGLLSPPTITLIGGAGGRAYTSYGGNAVADDSGHGGVGAMVTGALQFVPAGGTVLYLSVGKDGVYTNLRNNSPGATMLRGGGGAFTTGFTRDGTGVGCVSGQGGSASAISLGGASTADFLDQVLAVAGGGGGGGARAMARDAATTASQLAAGGDAGQDGAGDEDTGGLGGTSSAPGDGGQPDPDRNPGSDNGGGSGYPNLLTGGVVTLARCSGGGGGGINPAGGGGIPSGGSDASIGAGGGGASSMSSFAGVASLAARGAEPAVTITYRVLDASGRPLRRLRATRRRRARALRERARRAAAQ